MKVLYIIDSFQVGGAEKSLLDITSHIVGAEVVVCGVYKRDDLIDEFKKRGIPTYHLKIEGKYNWLTAFNKICEIVEKENPDVVHATLLRSCILSRFIGRKYKLPVINSIVSDSYGVERLSAMKLMRRIKHTYTFLLDKLTARYVNLFISNSEAVKRSYASEIGVSETKIQTIYRGRQAEKFAKEDTRSRRDILPTLDLHGQFVFICVGRLVESKGHLLLLNSFQTLTQKYTHVSLLVVGEGPERGAIEDFINDRGLQEKVILLGSRNDIPDLLSISNAFVTSTFYEGLSGAIIEAMFSKLPIIASDIEPNLELIGEDRGWAFSKGNSVDLLDKMELLIQTKQATGERVEKALQFANAHLEISSVANKYYTTYNKLINANSFCRYKAN